MSDTDDRYSKVEREIIEILDEMEDGKASRPDNIVDFRRPKRSNSFKLPSARPRLSSIRNLITPGKLLIFALVLAVLALFSRGYSAPLAGLFAVLSVVCFASLLFVRSSPTIGAPGGTQTKRWRGRDIEFGPSRNTEQTNRLSRLWRWFK